MEAIDQFMREIEETASIQNPAQTELDFALSMFYHAFWSSDQLRSSIVQAAKNDQTLDNFWNLATGAAIRLAEQYAMAKEAYH